MISLDVNDRGRTLWDSCYFIVPRIMTSIEGDPLLIEDLRDRRQELSKQLGLIDTSNDQLRHLIKEKMRKRFFSLAYLLRQYVRREQLTTILAERAKNFRAMRKS